MVISCYTKCIPQIMLFLDQMQKAEIHLLFPKHNHNFKEFIFCKVQKLKTGLKISSLET